MTNNNDDNKKDSINDRINKVFGVEFDLQNSKLPVEADDSDDLPVKQEEEQEGQIDKKQLEEDFQNARESLQFLVEKSQEAIAHYQHIAEQSESPRAFEVFAQLLNSAAGLSKDSMEIYERKANIDKKDDTPSSPMNISGSNVVVTTTSDLQKQLQQNKEDNDGKE